MASHNDLGKIGEDLAVDFLQKGGYAICERNWRFKKAEVDIIAKKNGVLAVVEVKTRSSNYFGDPQDFIKSKKIKLLVEAVDQYVNSKELDVEVRFDIIAITKQRENFEIVHLKDAFLHF
jgi:putative endonuclease